MLIFDYFLWHYLQAPKKYLQIWGNYLRYFVGYFIPVPQLLKTLFSPWKRDVVSYGRGFELKKFAETLLMNQISRVIGAVVRTIVIVFALFLEMSALIFGFAGFIFWMGWPLFLAGSFVSGIYLLFQPGLIKAATLFIVAFDLATIFIFYLIYQKSKLKMPQQMSLPEILEQDWADMIWKRLGINPKQVPQEVKDEP
ncbi:MAG: hypothetical protein FJZ15_06430, partial [Candidatus Omnitrophica bacterium]|nr:hypothetical protein [Candidatus Omnitrophota bacterium]